MSIYALFLKLCFINNVEVLMLSSFVLSSFVKVKEGMTIWSLTFCSIYASFLAFEDLWCKDCFNQNLQKGEIVRYVEMCWLHFVKTKSSSKMSDKMSWHVGATSQRALFRILGKLYLCLKSLKILFTWLVVQEACVSISFLCLFNAAIYLNCISKIDLAKIYFEKI